MDQPHESLEVLANYYRSLYSANPPSLLELDKFFVSLKIPQWVSSEDKDWLDAPITLSEVILAIDSLKLNISPGIDGLTALFYFKN